MSNGMNTGFRIPLVISLSPWGTEFYNKINSKVTVKIKWENTYRNVNFKAKCKARI